MISKYVHSFILILLGSVALSQEGLLPLGANINYLYPDLTTASSREAAINFKSATLVSDTIPFLEDFFYAPTSNYPDQKKWMDSSVYVNSGYPIAPPSIGVATFDGLNRHGYPYTPTSVNMNLSLAADTLTSRPINLFMAGGVLLEPASRVALTFYYQAKGYGDLPEASDSLLLDFYKPVQKVWKNVWGTKGISNANSNDTTFKRAFVSVKEQDYFNDGFQFRFRNKATTSGDFDHWHVDYVYLDRNRDSIADTLYNDLTFANVPTSFLSKYSAMPFQQYNTTEMAQKISVRIKNNSNTNFNIAYENKVYDSAGLQLHQYQGGFDNLLPFKPNGYSTVTVHANPTLNYTFAPMSDSADLTIQHYVYRTGQTSDFFKKNDSLLQYQRFRNYYAFDDGSAEAGYYVKSVGGKMAVKVQLNVPDTLRAVRIYFAPVILVKSAVTYSFKINVWAAGDGIPGTVTYTESAMMPVFYKTGYKGVPEYKLSQPLLLPAGTYYIGIQQLVAEGYVTVGFDRNYDRRASMFYDAGSGWKQSDIGGSLMIRPVFGKVVPPPVGIYDHGTSFEKKFSVFPNPSTGLLIVNLSGPVNVPREGYIYRIINSLGQLSLEGRLESSGNTINAGSLEPGVYFLTLDDGGSTVHRQKIILQR
jgi:hypothetical protein